MATDIYGIEEIVASQSQKYVTHNEANRVLEALLSGAVSRSNAGPPGSPAAGDVYIVDSATGAWSTASVGDIAHYYASAWHFTTPVEGTRLWIRDENALLRYNGSAWENIITDQGVALLGSAVLGMQTADGAQTIFTVPTGKKMVVHAVVIREPTGSLAGGTGFDIGAGASRNDWKTGVSLAALGTTQARRETDDGNDNPVYAAGATFGMNPVTGSTGDFDATWDLYGTLIDA